MGKSVYSLVNNQKRSYSEPARIIRAARKRMGLTQSEIAKKLCISQSKFSKFEHAILLPDMIEWGEFCNFAGIPINSYLIGHIDHASPVQICDLPDFYGSFKIPRKFARASGSKVRTTFPLLQYFEHRLGAHKTNEYLESRGFDPDFFSVFDFQVNMGFNFDLIDVLIQRGYLRPDNMEEVSAFVKKPTAHGAMTKQYQSVIGSQLDLMKAFIGNTNKYDSNCEYLLEDADQNSVVISSALQSHTQVFKKQLETSGIAMCAFKKHYLAMFASFQHGPNAVVVERECAFQGGTRCVYELQFVS